MPLRIAMIAYTHFESDPRVRREAEALAGRGDEVSVYCLRADGSPERAIENGVRVERIRIPRYRGGKAAIYVGSYAQFLIASGALVSRAHARARFDVVHVHTMPDFMVFGALIPRLSGAKVLLDMHDLMPELYALKFGLAKEGKVVGALRLIQRAATAFADAVVCVHRNQYELLLRDGVPAWKLAIVMNAADPALFPPRSGEPPPEPDGALRLVYHGTILERYGVDLAVRAFARAREHDRRLRFSIWGGGDFVADVRAVADELGLSPDTFDMSGEHRPLDEVARRIRSAHIGVVPNRDDQEDSVLPTKLLEYVAVGIPAVATRTRCVGRFFKDTEVELVDVGDVDGMARAILRLASDPARRRELVENAHRWEEEYGWEVNRKNFFRTVDALCFEKLSEERRAKQKQKQKEGSKEGERPIEGEPSKGASRSAEIDPARPKKPSRRKGDAVTGDAVTGEGADRPKSVPAPGAGERQDPSGRAPGLDTGIAR